MYYSISETLTRLLRRLRAAPDQKAETLSLSLQKRRLERALREHGMSRTEALRVVATYFDPDLP